MQDGLVLCEVNSWMTGRRLVSLPFSDHCDPLVEDLEALTPFVTALQRQTIKGGWRYIEIRPLHSIYRAASLFQSTETYLFHQVDLNPDLSTLFRNFHKDSIQRKIRRAEREKLTYCEGSNEGLLKAFYSLLLFTRRRHQVPPQPLRWFRNLIDCFGEALKIRVAFRHDEPVASILTLQYKDTLTYKYGCSDVRFNNLGGTQMLFWKAIQDAKTLGLCRLDLGRSDIANPGLSVFKDRWGATRSELTYLRWSAKVSSNANFMSPANNWKLRIARRMLAHVPDTFLSAMSSVLYRHLG